MNYNKLYGIESGKTYYACDKNCPVCEEWRKPCNTWKMFTFFPYHCANCYYAGYTEDFHVIQNIFVCLECKNKYKKRLKQVLLGNRVLC